MTKKPSDRSIGSPTPDPSDLMTEILAHDDLQRKQWRLMCDNDNAARRALYSARAQLD